MNASLATGRQASYLATLMEQTLAPDGSNRTVSEVLRCSGVDPASVISKLTKSEASSQIDYYVNQPKSEKAEAGEPSIGVHLLDGDVYKVQAAKGSGRKYAKKLGERVGSKAQWVYTGRDAAFSRLNDETLMTLEQASEFGVRTGMCAVCGRELTVEESVARGIGPVCATRF